jgi:hypothetical protein
MAELLLIHGTASHYIGNEGWAVLKHYPPLSYQRILILLKAA